MARKKNKKPIKHRTKKLKNLTAADSQNIRILAEQLGKILPLDGYRSKFSLAVIAKNHKLSKFLPKKSSNKKEVFVKFIENLTCYKPRTLKKIIREILPIAIERRHSNGNPILEDEAQQLIHQLLTLGIDMKKEIIALKLPKERPKVVPPPIQVQKILDAFILHPIMLPDCKTLFIGGHLNEAVRKSLERFEKTVQDISTLQSKQGPDLMALAFSEQNPKIKLSQLKTIQETNEQIGFKFLTMGLMQWWRNNLSHGDEPQLPHHEALGRLITVSNLFFRLDSRYVGI